MFARSTPVGVLLGADPRVYLKTQAALYVKACALSLAAGVFLYMGCLHEMKHPPLVAQRRTVRGFAAMAVGVAITAFVRLALGLAHSGRH